MIRYLIEKEFKQFRRNSFLPKLVIMFPIMIMLVMPNVATMDIKGVNVAVVDNDRSTLSARLISKIENSTYFTLRSYSNSYSQAIDDLEHDKADLILEIPSDFEKCIDNGEYCDLLVAANAVNGTKGSLGSSYMASIITQFSNEIKESKDGAYIPQLNISVLNMYNPTLDYRQYMIPAFVALLIILLCGFLPSLNIVSEKEKGTIEQINVTPVGKFQFILAKLIPYWIIGFVVMTICFILAWIVYDYLPNGNFGVIYVATAIFILVISSLGLIVSNFSQTMQQSMLVMFFFILIFNLMSGLFTPVNSMPQWAQWISAFIPPKYYIEIMRGVYQRGCGFADLIPQFTALLLFALVLCLISVISYRKRA